MSTNQTKIRGAVIGYGGAFNMGKSHGNHMKRVGFEFSAACDLDPARMEQAAQDFPGLRTYTDVQDLLAQPDIDLVTVITPHNTHAALAEQVLLNGKHCILEKPMCIHADDADKLVKLAKEKGLMLSVFHNRRWDGWYLTVKDLMEKGVIGDIFHVEMFMGGYSAPKEWWRENKEISGGAFYDWGAHYIDYLLGIVPGKIRSVRGTIHNRVWHQKTNEDQVDSMIFFENGAIAHVEISSIARVGKARFRILGTKGAVEVINTKDGKLNLYTDADGQNQLSEVEFLKDRQSAYYDNIADYLLRGAELIVKPEEARRIIAVIETTERSAKEAKELPVPYENE
ncbi:Gfo/Idh/MocA family protein [Paenibacillus allorhizosphaerae]|uniref:Scyllo-inositol 2-dehydrogenase (NADP(+)) IolW n=1 Tax=Paenibacillus allorhizosphaerae TaxID=2849866 RepID=A0ABM8VI93_9BACL|nr:Gfo/Idh/MocA family oxidoreductase [Paenibacillus allorhizosphaerae]CAG7643807.1 scyllo-inositol 2-dehydrogenase (NADP(+)) IolW [Paenibacillus allorhizosphaerae]